MKVCLKNMKHIFYNYQLREFGYFQGNCYIENGSIIGYGFDEEGFDNVYDMNGKLVIPMFTNMSVNLEDMIYRKIQNNWDPFKYKSLVASLGHILKENDKNFFENIAPDGVEELVDESATGIIGTSRCETTLTKAPLFAFSGYPVSRTELSKEYLDNNLFHSIYQSTSTSNIIHGIDLGYIFDNDEGSLSFAKDKFTTTSAPAKFISCNFAMSDLCSNQTMQKFTKTEIDILREYGFLTHRTLLFGCNNVNDKDLLHIKDANANVIFSPATSKALKCTMCNPSVFDNLGITWCLASGPVSMCDTTNQLYHMKLVHEEFPEAKKENILRAATAAGTEVMQKVTGINMTNLANFTIMDSSEEVHDLESALEYIFNVDYKNVKMELMLLGNVIHYDKPQTKTEEYKDYLRKWYKRFDMFLENPNMFEQEVPKKI